MLPVVSVVIPTYKHAEYVLATLESVFAQTFTSYEVIVVNDGSPDNTAAKLQPLVDAGRIRYFEQPNAGQSAARNRGLAEARGSSWHFWTTTTSGLPRNYRGRSPRCAKINAPASSTDRSSSWVAMNNLLRAMMHPSAMFSRASRWLAGFNRRGKL